MGAKRYEWGMGEEWPPCYMPGVLCTGTACREPGVFPAFMPDLMLLQLCLELSEFVPEFRTMLDDSVQQKNATCAPNILDITTRSPPLCSPSSLP